jgi:hypothetical protein
MAASKDLEEVSRGQHNIYIVHEIHEKHEGKGRKERHEISASPIMPCM